MALIDPRQMRQRPLGNDTALMGKAYARWAPIYDFMYRRITAPGRREAVKAAEACGRDILEIGVGTGMSLQEYVGDVNVIGTDLSPAMLRRAVKKIADHGLTHVKGLAVMDACRLGFPDEAFDAVAAQMVITLVPDPESALDEFARVLKPGGEIVLVNHFGAAGGWLAGVEEAVAPVASLLGWSSNFRVARIEAWARQSRAMRLVSVKPMPPGGFFTVLRLKKDTGAATRRPIS